jgi:hypothetical protein
VHTSEPERRRHARVRNLTDIELLQNLGIGPAELTADDMDTCRQLGGGAHWLERDGLPLPSARSRATNLVIYHANRPDDARFEVLGAELIR